MARGRELLAQKVTGQKRNDIRWKEITDGKLSMPHEPRTLYVLTGTAFDSSQRKGNRRLSAMGHLLSFRDTGIYRAVDRKAVTMRPG